MSELSFCEKVENSSEQLNLSDELFQLLYNLAESIDLSIDALESGSHYFGTGEVYRSARSNLGVCHLVFKDGTKAHSIYQEMIAKVTSLSHKANN